MPETTGLPDPLAVWREWIAEAERQWNSALNQAMGTDQYREAVGRFMQLYAASQKGLADLMSRQLTALNMPTRTDVVALGERLGAIEDRLARIEAALSRAPAPSADASATSVDPSGAIAPVRPPRTRKPPGAEGGPSAPGRSERSA